jgi:lipoprotein-releasing system permease protein
MNIISGLVMLVKNKGRDIAILRTMGAGQGSILRIFFMAGDHRSALGTAAGLLIGVAVLHLHRPDPELRRVGRLGQAVFSSDVYFLSRHPGQGRLERGGVIIVFWALTMPRSWRPCRRPGAPRVSIRWRRFAMSDPVLSIRGLEPHATSQRRR